MSSDPIRLVEEYFASHDGDGEFVVHRRSVPYSVIWPRTAFAHLVLTTKPDFLSMVAARTDHAVLERVAMIGGYGLPNVDDLELIGSLPESTGLCFLGDLDPVDLMIYAWLRARLPSRNVAYLGIGDKLLSVAGAQISELPSIALAPSETRSMAILHRTFPDIRETVGNQCLELLSRGRKIELEAVADSVGSTDSVFRRLGAG